MRSLIIIAGGLVLLTILALAAWRIGGNAQSAATAAKVFIPIWLVAAFVNMWLGVSRAGYSWSEELPIFLVIFAIPAAAAVVLWWKAA